MISAPLIVYFDGLCEPSNPGGHACGGWCVDGHPDLAGGRQYCSGPEATNNVAEYHAALDALRAVYAAGYRGPVRLYGDSKLVVEQVTGHWQCNAPHLIELRDQLKHAMTFFESVTVDWIPRESNEQADEQSRLAYQRETGTPAPIRQGRNR